MKTEARVSRPKRSNTIGTSAMSGMFWATRAIGKTTLATRGTSTESAASTKAVSRPLSRPSAAIGRVWPTAASKVARAFADSGEAKR